MTGTYLQRKRRTNDLCLKDLILGEKERERERSIFIVSCLKKETVELS